MKDLKPHPLAELLPMMSRAEYASLRESIRDNGQADPIELYQGKILDGRNRYRACRELGIAPKTRQFTGGDAAAVQLVYARANHRNLNDTQKACAALRFLPHFEKLAISRMKTRGCGTGSTGSNGKARDHAGELFGVSGRYLSDARAVLESDPKLFQACFEGREFLSRAKRIIARANKTRRLRVAVRSLPAASHEGSDWKVIAGDCIEALEAVPSGSARLVFADPPYNIGIDYGRGAKADRLDASRYYDWCESWLSQCQRICARDGSLFVMIPGNHLATFEVILQGASGCREFHRRNVIVWHETFGQYQSGNFTDCWRAILYYTASAVDFVWHGDAIRIPSDRQAKYGDCRADPAGKVPPNVWTFPRLVDNAAERVPGFPTQVPQALVERIVQAASDPGDLVVDPFTGSGTTGAAAVRCHRRFLGIEIEAPNVEAARARIALAAAERSV